MRAAAAAIFLALTLAVLAVLVPSGTNLHAFQSAVSSPPEAVHVVSPLQATLSGSVTVIICNTSRVTRLPGDDQRPVGICTRARK